MSNRTLPQFVLNKYSNSKIRPTKLRPEFCTVRAIFGWAIWFLLDPMVNDDSTDDCMIDFYSVKVVY